MSSKSVSCGEPLSYEQVEKTLSNGSRSGEATQEASSTPANIDTKVQLSDKTSRTRTGESSHSPQNASEKPLISLDSTQTNEMVKKIDTPCTAGESAEHIRTAKSKDPLVSQVNPTSGKGVAELLSGSSSSKVIPKPNGTATATRNERTARDDDCDTRSGPPRVIHAHLSTGQANGRPSSGTKSGTSLRRGKWTMEEEAYVARVIQDFNSGFLNAPAGTTLRSYLSDKLQCDPMRITKKFTGDACIGKRVFHPAVRSAANASSIDKAQAELDALERRWRRRLEMQQRESAKKAAASAAAANSPIQGRGQGLVQGVPLALLGGSGNNPSSIPATGDQLQQHAVAQAASWLDRANAILKGSKASACVTTGEATKSAEVQAFDSMPSNEIENQMKEVQRLIYEGPTIKKATAGLQTSLSESVCSDSSDPEPADKRMRTTATQPTGAEDAEALVGFLRSVRAAASQESS